MTIPDKPLELDLDANELTLEDASIFDVEEAEQNPFGYLNKIRKFLLRYSTSWTRDEINKMTLGDAEQITQKMLEALTNVTVPLASEKD